MPTVLIVEDNEASRDALARRLQRLQYTVLLAVDGQQAIAIARSHTPDVILMDLGLPGVDGWEATEELKRGRDTQHIPIIVLSAHAMMSDREQALALGADDFDTKPVHLPRLIQKMEQLMTKAVP